MFPNVPELLKTIAGAPVETAEQWRSLRRPEILGLFRRRVYGRNPVDRPSAMTFAIAHKEPAAMDGAATLKQVNITYAGPFGEATVPVTLFIPNRRKVPAPAFVYINIGDRARIDPTRQQRHETWPAEAIIDRGFAAAAFHVDDLAPNLRPAGKAASPANTVSAAQAVFEKPGETRPPDAWGTIATWAWGASRVMDYLEIDNSVDANRVAAIGHSRAGKTALWAGAQDERFAMVISNNSGSTGAALARGKSGMKAETIADINQGFPAWFCQNYKHYDHAEENLPVDQHMLLALVAPRLLYVASGADDAWACPPAEYASLILAQPAWQLYRYKALPGSSLPPMGTILHSDKTAYHIRPGPHGLTTLDWQHYLDYAANRLSQ